MGLSNGDCKGNDKKLDAKCAEDSAEDAEKNGRRQGKLRRFWPSARSGQNDGGVVGVRSCCRRFGRWFVLVFAGFGLCLAASSAQQVPATTRAAEFEVVSIRPSKTSGPSNVRWGTAPDGYSVAGQSMRITLFLAYFPQGIFYWDPDHLLGAPKWIDDLYDIDARVATADLQAWQAQGPALEQKPMLAEMLQTMLAERCKLVVHRTPSQTSGWELVVSKHGAKLTEAKPNEPLPEGAIKLADGGRQVAPHRGETPRTVFYAASMASLARFLSGRGGGPVLDRTGLTGRYNFAVLRRDDADNNNPGPMDFPLQELGLEIRPIKIPMDAITIDHIEKPSEN